MYAEKCDEALYTIGMLTRAEQVHNDESLRMRNHMKEILLQKVLLEHVLIWW